MFSYRIRKRRSKLHREYLSVNDEGDYYIYDEQDNAMNTNPIYLGNGQFGDYVMAKALNNRYEKNLSVQRKELIIISSRDAWHNYMQSVYDMSNYQVLEYGEERGIVIDLKDQNFIKYDVQSGGSVKLRLYGDDKFIADNYNSISDKFQVVKSHIQWVYSTDGSSIDIPLSPDRIPLSEMYPFLGDRSLDEYYDRYMESNSNIIILIGPPGTGKTSWIRGFLHHCEQSAIVTYDTQVLERDFVFADFIESNHGVMVIEDADLFLRSRADGNAMIHKFLNVGDGLVSAKNKKIIFSTNLPSVRDIDPALIRPGRCFDILEFNLLNSKQAEKLANKVGIKLNNLNTKESWSIAEIFNQTEAQFETKQKSMNKKFGFY